MQKERLEQLNEFLKNNTNDSFIKFAIALEYIKKNDDRKALEYFSDILNNDPDYVGTYYHLGKLYERLGEKENAIKSYEAGMNVTKEKNEQHAFSELQEALNQLVDED